MAQRSQSDLAENVRTPLGQTSRIRVQISGADGSIFPTTIYSCINVGGDPELAERLLEGTLNDVPCPVKEDRIYRPAQPVVYHDEIRQIFALVLPEALRHRELQCRQELLQRLSEHPDTLPSYMHRFSVVFDLEKFLASAAEFGGEPSDWAEEPTKISDPPEMPVSDEERTEFEVRIKELQDHIASLENEDSPDPEAEKLRVDRAQLDEVAFRVDRDSARVEEARAQVQVERAELESLRQELDDERRQLQVKELNLEQQKIRIEQQGPEPEVVESTQVVTDDQFIEVVSSDGSTNSGAVGEAHSLPLEPAESEVIAENFDEHGNEDASFFIKSLGDFVVIGCEAEDDRLQHFLAGRTELLFQLQKDDEIPVIAVTLAAFNEDGTFHDALSATLTDADENEALILGQLAQGREIHVAIYGSDGLLVTAWKSKFLVPKNISWGRRRLSQWREAAGPKSEDKIRAAAARIAGGEFDLWGTMQHPFLERDFHHIEGASQVQLAVGIVEYWSQAEQVDYLVGKRAFSVDRFIEIQKSVIRQALHWGIAIGEQLRDIAIEEAIITDRISLTERLLANFAEVCVGLRANDLDPLEQWENWDALIQLADEIGVGLDPDVVELAEVSLKRAEEFEESLDAQGPVERPVLDEQDVIDDLVVSRHSEHTGVTYFLPDEAVMDTFDDLSDMERSDLVLLLKDNEGRLEAAQILVERFGADGLTEVLEAAEEMNAAQVTALARFIEVRADTLEAALTQALDTAGPSATFIAARALASIGSTAALPRLLEAVCDPKRRGHGRRLARCLASFGDKILPPLTRALKRGPDDKNLLLVLASLEEDRAGTLDEMSSDRSQALRNAARQAREMV